jgi:transposase InsO family protein
VQVLLLSKTTYLLDRKLQSITLFAAPEAISLHQKERQVRMKCIVADVHQCIFVHPATRHLHVEFQKHLNTHETLKAKESFELMCHNHDIIPQAYHSDNGSSFTSSGFTARLCEFAQVMSFDGTAG